MHLLTKGIDRLIFKVVLAYFSYEHLSFSCYSVLFGPCVLSL